MSRVRQIEVQLSRRFGALTALDHLTFEMPAGQVVRFLGPSPNTFQLR